MATTNQRNRSGGQKNIAAAQNKAQEVASQAGHKMADLRDDMAGYVSQGAEQFGQMTRGHEGQATLIALAAGFGVGLVIGVSLASSHRKPQTWGGRMLGDDFGRKFMDRVERMIPDAVAQHFGR